MKKNLTISLFFLSLFLAVVGLIIIFSVSANFAFDKFGDSFYFFKRQMLWVFIGFICQVFIMRMDYHKLYKWAPMLFMIGLILLLVVLIPQFSAKVGGARRWIRLGFIGFQPSEFMKLISVLFMAKFLSDRYKDIRTFFKGFLYPFFILTVILGCIIAEKDLGTAIIIGSVLFAMFFVAGIRPVYLFSLVFSAIPLLFYAIYKYPFRIKRIAAFLNPWADPQNTSYQIIQSLVAITSGGWFGKGLGEGIQKYYYLPEAHTDFIFSIYGEETGLLGCLFLIGVFIILIFCAIKITLKASDLFGYLLGFGLTFLFGIQCIINIGVVTSLLPTKGTPLPFISFGGSSLVMNMIAIGILISIEKYSRQKPI